MKILVGVDESKFSEEALRAIVAQFRPQSAEIRVLHAKRGTRLIYIAQVPHIPTRHAHRNASEES